MTSTCLSTSFLWISRQNLNPTLLTGSLCEPPARKRSVESRQISSALPRDMYKVRTIIEKPRTSPGFYRICCSTHGKFHNPISDFSCKPTSFSSPTPLRHPCPFCLPCLLVSPSSPSSVIVLPISLPPSPQLLSASYIPPAAIFTGCRTPLPWNRPHEPPLQDLSPLTTSQYKQVHNHPPFLRKLSEALATNPPRQG